MSFDSELEAESLAYKITLYKTSYSSTVKVVFLYEQVTVVFAVTIVVVEVILNNDNLHAPRLLSETFQATLSVFEVPDSVETTIEGFIESIVILLIGDDLLFFALS